MVSTPVSGKVKDVPVKLLGMSEAQEVYASLQRDHLRLGSIAKKLDLLLSVCDAENYVIGALNQQ